MKFSRISLAAAACFLIAGASAVAQPLTVSASGTKRVTLSDQVGKNQFSWTSDAPLEKIMGTCEGVTGTISIDPKNPSGITGTISASTGTMKTGNATRDGHVKSAQWLDASAYPAITFRITRVSGLKAAGINLTGTATGAFTMHGVTRTISVPFTLKYIDASPATAKRAPGDLVQITTTFSIALKDFNVAGARGMVGSKVGETIDITANLFGSTGL
jgi:polyisoprenoid-binding protein YceI